MAFSGCDDLDVQSPTPSPEAPDGAEEDTDGEKPTPKPDPDPDPEPDPMWEIVDLAYELNVGESLPDEYTLTGVVYFIDLNGKNDIIKIKVVGRESKPIQCYGILGDVESVKIGDTATVSGTLTNYKGTIEFNKGCLLVSSAFVPNDKDIYADVSKTEFYRDYTRATSNEDAYYRSLHGLMSGDVVTPDEAPTVATNRPKQGNQFIRNADMQYSESGNAYTVVDSNGEPAFTVYRDGAYITLEDVAAYVYAFGTYPINYTEDKNPSVASSVWGEYLRANHTAFSGNTSKYPYEPVLPNISGVGGSLDYYEMDVGTTGTYCDVKNYPPDLYNDGSTITRGAARIVYGKKDLNENGIYEEGEFHLFYTYNHYNDFQEYLNYENGWGATFGNITGGGTLSSTSHYSPTAYEPVAWERLPALLSLR